MQGLFQKKSLVAHAMLLTLPLFLLTRYIESDFANDVVAYSAAVLIPLAVLASFFFNRKAYIVISEKQIKGKYHWFSKINCRLADVAFVSAKGNTLTIQLANGKRHSVIGIYNAWELCVAIRRRLPFKITDIPSELIEQIKAIQKQRKRDIVWTCVGTVLMVCWIVTAIILTNAKALSVFDKIDWLILGGMGITEVITVIATFCFANRAGKAVASIEQRAYIIRRTVIETQSFTPGNVKYIYTDDNYSGRVILFGYPNAENVYYSLQEFQPDYTLKTVYTSEVYDDRDHLPDAFHGLIDITNKFFS